MRFFVSRVLAGLVIVALLCCVALAMDQNLAPCFTTSSSQSLSRVAFYSDANSQPEEGTRLPPAAMTQQPNGDWLSSSDPSQKYSFGGLPAVCDDCPKRGLVAFVGYDTWKGISDAGWQNNGIHTGLNFGTRLGQFSELTCIGFQIGGSVGAYDWGGTDFRLSHQDQAQPQGFITYGFFRKANADSKWTVAVVEDLMLNSNYGVFAENPTLGQGRAQVGYATSARNEFGLWGTWRMLDATRNVNGFGSVSWRAINQLNAFWHHKWSPGGADTSIWVGVPERDRLGSNGSLGDYMIGIAGNFPMSDRAAVYTLITYMHASAAAGAAGFDEEAWNFSIGLSLYPARNARSSTVAGQCWMPQLPVANNGYFLVDTNRTF